MNRPLQTQHHTILHIPGPVGRLQAMLSPSNLLVEANTSLEVEQLAIICHPHPLYGGTMYNKVVTTLSRTLRELGLATIRFNYRGVEESEGSYGAGIGETEDLKAVLSWSRTCFPNLHSVWLAGFSFGCYIAASVAAQDSEIKRLITVAPAVNHFDFYHFRNIHCPWFVIMGEADEIVPLTEVQQWVSSMPQPIQAIYLPGVSHFFHSQLGVLREQLLVKFNQ